MGIETMITCDKCGKNLKNQDYVTIEHKFELDNNYTNAVPDERHRHFQVFCTEDGREYWHKLMTEVT